MHDLNLEERLRSVLRAEGDSLPFTITTDELERRLALRRRNGNGRRLSLMAAGLAAIAVGTVFAVGNGWLRGTNVATDPSSAPTASIEVAPSTSPPTTPEPTPRVANPVGAVDEALLVTPVGGDSRRPDAFEVTRFHPATGISVLVATIPGSVIPEDGWLDLTGPPKISATGWLAIPFTRGLNEDVNHPAIAIVDTQAPQSASWILDGHASMSWDSSDKLVLEQDGRISIAWPGSEFVQTFSAVGATVANAGTLGATGPAITTEDFTRFLATRLDDEAWGYVGYDGRFTATNDLPPVYQRTGLERPAGAGAHGLGEACDSGGDAASSGCFLVESNERHEPIATWLEIDKTPLYDFSWAVDGRSAWLLIGGPATGNSTTATLVYAATANDRADRAQIELAHPEDARILGISDEPAPGSATIVAIGDTDGVAQAFVLADGTVRTPAERAWFAGWAVDPPPYDPD